MVPELHVGLQAVADRPRRVGVRPVRHAGATPSQPTRASPERPRPNGRQNRDLRARTHARSRIARKGDHVLGPAGPARVW